MTAVGDPGRRRRVVLAAVAASVLVSGGLVHQASEAAFTATTANAGNSWTAGTVTLSDDDSGSAMFTVAGLTPGDPGERCLVVSYAGDVPSTVSLYASATGTLAPHLNLTVQTGAGGGFGDPIPCTGFVAGATIWSGTLADLAATATDFTSGLPAAGRWAPGAPATRVYRFVYEVADDDAAQGLTATATFTWEARSS